MYLHQSVKKTIEKVRTQKWPKEVFECKLQGLSEKRQLAISFFALIFNVFKWNSGLLEIVFLMSQMRFLVEW